ncbi:MAG TPA: imidazole glycerol phosphate synthase subunit HisH [Anaerolineae bacterium]|nr:imidazole glycerol phosphate synthase subunit HisH [Anaerolineae bacterium]
MLTILDYGVGNLRSVYMAFRRLGLDVQITSEAKALRRASAIVLPGVGAFGDAIGSIRALGLEDAIVSAIGDGVPFLGICMGLQLLFEVSEEMGEHRGLGILAGRVRRFPQGQRVPHMGWNEIHQVRAIRLWDGVPDRSYAYFVHSYYADPEDESVVAGSTDYGLDYASAVARGNVYAIQFHPEKSQDVGESILRNFAIAAGLLEKQP